MTAFAFDVGVAGRDLFVGDIMRYFLMLYVGLPLAILAVSVAAIKFFDWLVSPKTPRPTKTQQTSPPTAPRPPLSPKLGLPKYPA